MQQFIDKSNSFAAAYEGIIQQGWAVAQARGYPSTIAMRLHANDIPLEVKTNLISTAREAAPTLQRYHRLRQQVMGLERYGWSDMFRPLIADSSYFDYAAVQPWIIESVAVLGDAYQSRMAEQLAAGWVDVHETPGKRGGAYNSGRYGVGSFVLLNYKGSLDDVFTLAHEMGHSMHTRLAHENQPYPTHRYTIFIAEIAAILNEKLLLDYLLDQWQDPQRRAALLEAEIDKIRGTFLLQTMMADYELRAHAFVENGGGLTADKLTELWRDVVTSHFGDLIPDDDPYFLSWARIPHLFNSPFYVYQYATSLAAAAAFHQRFASDPQAVEPYLALLKAGGNDHPVAQLMSVGIDMRDPQVLSAVNNELQRLVDLLEQELRALGRTVAD
jgi:oligoendopeptidase F